MDELVIDPLDLTMHGMAFGVRRRVSKVHIALFARLEDARAFADAVNGANAERYKRSNYYQSYEADNYER